ncbi:MOB kinase activator-like 2 isoform X3 [Drosophila bipectinata]|uniref:MOB kinase activator-like 2 isoform X3 n=1 Tax=Drosophila bipectinata TaxID=42026 RepID=UPI001C89E721|nr:MOB kinase activator-like 2 isoform X3 [Drosophila bipectinata]
MKETLSSKVPTKLGVTFETYSDPKKKSKSSPTPSTSTTTSTNTTTTTTTTQTPPTTSYVIKCLLKTARFMWQVTTIPSKIGDTIGTLYRYAQDSVDSILCVAGKARRKERDGDQNSTDTKLYLEESVLERKLPEADLKALVDLPAGLDYNEWLASHTLALFEHVNLVYGTISEFCTQSGCADMTGPGNRTYLWFDEKGKKTRVAAPQYIDYVMTFTQKTVSDESIFPTKYANEFPGSFESIARKILRLQFHVIAHLYAAHFREIALLGLHTHLNLTFAHLTALHRRFNLIDEKETDVLRDLEVALRLTDQDSGGGGQDTANTSTSSSALHDHDPQQQHQQQQQQHNHHSSSTSNSTSSAEALHVNSQSNNGSTSASVSAVSLIDGDAAAPPICTQPEAGAGCKPAGSSGLLGGILGDLTSGEFGDTTRYCTSAVPQQGGTVAGAGVGVGVGVVTSSESTAALNNGAGALHLNFSNNNNNNHNLNHLNHHHHHHHHGHGHGHGHHGHHPHHAAAQQQHSGLIQCNAAGGGGGSVAAGGATAAAAASSTTTA